MTLPRRRPNPADLEPDEWYEHRIMELADGTRDASDVILAICGTHPNEASVRRSIWRLISSRRIGFDDELRLLSKEAQP